MLFGDTLYFESREAHHGHGHESYGDEGDAQSLQWFGHIAILHLLSDGSHRHYGEGPTDTAANSIDEGIEDGTDILAI